MFKLLLISFFIVPSAFALTNAEVLEALGANATSATGDIICNDNDTGVPGNEGLNVQAKEAYIYFKEGVSEHELIKKVLNEAKQHDLSPKYVKGSASLIPWGSSSCMNNKAIYSDFNKLKACNEPLAKKRAENVASIAKEVFGGIEQMKSAGISSEVGFSPNCKTYDDSKKEVYHKYQYVHIRFGRPNCSEAKIHTSVSTIGMSGGQCNGICTDGQSGKLADGTQCSRYVRLANNTSITFDALQVPDKFTMIKVEACKKNTADTTGYISTYHEFINNPSLLDKYRYQEEKSVGVTIQFDVYSCTHQVNEACHYNGGRYNCPVFLGKPKPHSSCSNLNRRDTAWLTANINPAVKLDLAERKVPSVNNSSITYVIANIESGNKAITSKSNALLIETMNKFNAGTQKNKTVEYRLEQKLKEIPEVKVSVGARKVDLSDIYRVVESASSKGLQVNKGPVTKSFSAGDYCLQVEAPDKGTAWTAK